MAERYDKLAITLHWVVAALVLCQISLGWWMLDLPKSPPGLRAGWFNVHKSIGLTIGLLVLFRLAWRIGHPPPPLPESMPRWQARAARASHFLLYAALIAQPLVGYLGSSFTPYPIKYFGLVLPYWGWDAPALKELCSAVHFGLACLISVLVAIHIAAALKHLLVNRDGVFQRMLPHLILVMGLFFLAAAHAQTAANQATAQRLSGSNPVFGLNTLGGVLTIQTKSGFAFPGSALRLAGGAFGRRSAEAETGGHGEHADYFAAVNLHHEAGWREHSPSALRQAFFKSGWQDARTDLDVSLALADNSMQGTQTLPLSMLQQPRQAYTWPDRTDNDLAFLDRK